MGHRFAALESLAEAALQDGLGSAIALSVGSEGQERFRLCRGHLWRVPTMGPPVGEHPWFDLASLTKPLVTAALAMRFVERGSLDLATPVRRWLGQAATSGTVAHLLGHAAGLAPHVRFYQQLLAGDFDGQRDARAALVHLASQHPLTYEPGAATVYSDLGYLVLGHVLECVGQAQLDELARREITEPLELDAHFVDLRAAGARRLPYVATELADGAAICGQVHDENARAGGGVFGHAGLFGRIEDVARLARALVTPRGWLRAETAMTFFTSAAGPGSWRLGWDTPATVAGSSHAGDAWPRVGSVGHLGFTGTSLWLALPQRRWVAILTNRVHPSRDGSAEGIKRLRRALMDAAWHALEG